MSDNSEQLSKFGLQYEELSVDDTCWILNDVGVMRGFITEKNGEGAYVTYTTYSYVSEMDTLVRQTQMPTGVVFGIGLNGDMSHDARKEKHDRLTKYWQSIFLTR